MVLVVLIVVGLVWSRAIVSIAPLLLSVPFILDKSNWVKNKWVLVSICFMVFPVLYSFYWSSNTADWWKSFSVKIPLFTLAIALLNGRLTDKTYQQAIDGIIIILLIASGWSIIQYIENKTAIEEGYLVAKTIPTLSDGDYGFFNWMVLFVSWLALFSINKNKSKIRKLFYISAVLLFSVFIHIMAVKKALLGFYGALFIIVCFAFIAKKKKKGFIIMASICICFLLAYLAFPTLRNRIQYTTYDFKENIAKPFTAGSNDGARWLSIKAGYDIMNKNPLTGVGFGDILNEVNQWHLIHHPSTPTEQRIKPMNQWLTYGVGSGWVGIVFFFIGLIILVRRTYANNAATMGLLWIAIVPLLTEDILEGQFGVVVFGLIFFFGIPYLNSDRNKVHESIGSHYL